MLPGTKLESPKSKVPPPRDRLFSLAGTQIVDIDVTRETYSRTYEIMKNCVHYVQNNKQKIVLVFVFFYLCVMIFSERFFSEYPTFKEN